jgi:hypothetical protein
MSVVVTSIIARELIPQNYLRKSLIVQNVDTVDSVFIKRERNSTNTVSATDFDFRLQPGAGIALNSQLDGTEAIQDRYTIIAAANTPSVSVFETEDIKR